MKFAELRKKLIDQCSRETNKVDFSLWSDDNIEQCFDDILHEFMTKEFGIDYEDDGAANDFYHNYGCDIRGDAADAAIATLTRYYVVETKFVGPVGQGELGLRKIEVRTAPARAKCSGKIITWGWCGTTNDFAVYAHGVYRTVEEAQAAITEHRIFR